MGKNAPLLPFDFQYNVISIPEDQLFRKGKSDKKRRRDPRRGLEVKK